MTAPVMEIQKLIRDTLLADAAVTALVTGVHDDVPAAAAFPYVSFGPTQELPDDAECIAGSEFSIQIDVWSRKKGRAECAALCFAVKKALHDVELELTEHALASIRMVSTRLFRDPDGITNHGVVTLQLLVEEA